MLEIRDYSIDELGEELDVSKTAKNRRSCIKKKLIRMDIQFTESGRGNSTIFSIKNIPDRFKTFCICEFGCATNTDFLKLREVFELMLNNEEFQLIPNTEKEVFLAARGITVSRATISNYIKKLTMADYLGGGEFHYMIVNKDASGNHTHIEIPQERYKEGWKIYWSIREDTHDYHEAYWRMQAFLGGHPRKMKVFDQNGFMLEKIRELQECIIDSHEKESNEVA